MKDFRDFIDEGFILNSYNEAYFDKAGIYVITNNFTYEYGDLKFIGRTGDLFKISAPLHIQDGRSEGYKGNEFYKWNKQIKSWKFYDHELGSKDPEVAQEFMEGIADYFKFVASKESSAKVKKLIAVDTTFINIFDTREAIEFLNTREAIEFLNTLDKKTKLSIKKL
jgi:hypothetical protein